METTEETRLGGSGSPMIGARAPMGEPGATATSFRVTGVVEDEEGLL